MKQNLQGQPPMASPPTDTCVCLSPAPSAPGGAGLLNLLFRGFALLALWAGLYAALPFLARHAAYGLLGLEENSRLGSAVEFFLYDTPKVLLLLTLVVFGMGVLRTFFTPERTRRALAGGNRAGGSVLAALLGVATPFCSCSAVPLFIGFVTAGVPLGVTFSFLVAAPMVNEIALALLWGLFGWKVAGLYLATGLSIAVASGWILDALRMERHVEPWVYEMDTGEEGGETAPPDWPSRLEAGARTTREIVGKVWPYLVAGIAVGAGIHGYAPENLLAEALGRDAWWSVPLAVLVGIPLYSNAAGILPVVQALLGKGAALGTVLAFMMAVIGLSLPETIILRRVLKPRLIAVFLGVVGTGILCVGYLFNLAL